MTASVEITMHQFYALNGTKYASACVHTYASHLLLDCTSSISLTLPHDTFGTKDKYMASTTHVNLH